MYQIRENMVMNLMQQYPVAVTDAWTTVFPLEHPLLYLPCNVKVQTSCQLIWNISAFISYL